MHDWMWNLFAVMATLEDSQRARLREKFYETSGGVREVIVSKQTMPFLRGLARTHNISDEQVPKLALGVLYVALGEWPLANLAAGLSSTMGIPNDVAQKAAAEIEKELFAPIMLELNKFLEEQRQPKAKEQAQSAGATNIVDLKRPTPPKFQVRRGPELPRPGEFAK